MLFIAVMWLLKLILPLTGFPELGSPFLPFGVGVLLGATCLLQFAISKWMDSRYEPNLWKNYYWMIWYPIAFWLITISASIIAFPRVLLREKAQRARWESPDRGIRHDR